MRKVAEENVRDACAADVLEKANEAMLMMGGLLRPDLPIDGLFDGLSEEEQLQFAFECLEALESVSLKRQ